MFPVVFDTTTYTLTVLGTDISLQITNSTTTGTIATAGARGLTVNHLTLALGLLSLFWL